MDTNNTVLTFREYGKVRVRLKDVLDARGMSRNELARAANTRFEVVDKWYRGSLEKIDADILARFCFILHCQIGDLLSYEEP
jgi:putative transcriptional regulator